MRADNDDDDDGMKTKPEIRHREAEEKARREAERKALEEAQRLQEEIERLRRERE